VDKKLKQSNGADGAALAAGKPVLRVVGGTDNRMIETMTRGMESLMNLLEMTPGKPANTRSPQFIDQTVSLDSPQTGTLSVYVQRGQNVRKGDLLGAIGTFHNKKAQEILSPIDGLVIYVMSTPPVNKGESIIMIGTPRE
jgi:hypothetical protein